MELLTDFFNLANKQNVTGVNTTGYFVSTGNVATAGGTVACSAAAPCLNFNTDNNFNPLFGSITNTNSNFVYSPRQIQMGADQVLTWLNCNESAAASAAAFFFHRIHCTVANNF